MMMMMMVVVVVVVEVVVVAIDDGHDSERVIDTVPKLKRQAELISTKRSSRVGI